MSHARTQMWTKSAFDLENVCWYCKRAHYAAAINILIYLQLCHSSACLIVKPFEKLHNIFQWGFF